MEALLVGLEGTSLAQSLRHARWGYAAVNAFHILGIALLVGAIVPLNLRTLGFWPEIPRRLLARVLVPAAAFGLIIAASAGLLLFATRATEYADLDVFRLKMTLIAVGTMAALSHHLRHGWPEGEASSAAMKAHALLSLACWLGALACGRLIAFVGD